MPQARGQREDCFSWILLFLIDNSLNNCQLASWPCSIKVTGEKNLRTCSEHREKQADCGESTSFSLMGKFPASGQRKPYIFQVHLVSARHHSLFKPSPLSLAAHLSLLSPDTHTDIHTHICLDVAEKTKTIRWTPAPTSFFHQNPSPTSGFLPHWNSDRGAEGLFSAPRPV